MAPLSRRQREIYDRDGAVFPLPALPRSAATDLADTVSSCFTEGDGRFTQECAHMCYGWADELVRNPSMLDAAQSIIGENILVWETTCWVKFPGQDDGGGRSDGGFVSFGWHQDTAFWGIAPDEHVVTAWIALSDVPASSGPVMYIPGTHAGPWLPQTQTSNEAAAGESSIRLVGGASDLQEPVKAVLGAGEFLLFHGRLAHCSEPMDSDWHQPRVGVSIRYMSTAARQHYGPDEAMLVRGVDEHRHFHLHSGPAQGGDLSAAAVRDFERMMARRQVVLGEGKRRGPGVVDADAAADADAAERSSAARL